MDFDRAKIGILIQDYARARWGRKPDRVAAARLGARLEDSLRERIDVLGADVERLLAIDAKRVLYELQALEAEAALEDAGKPGPATEHPVSTGGHPPRAPHRRRRYDR